MIGLVEVGIEEFLINANVEEGVEQRVVRRVCLECKVEYEPTDEMLMELELTQSDVQGRTFFYGKGCRECNNSGYKGRVALFEIMQMTDRLRDVIMTGASTQEVQKPAREEGKKTIRDAGLIVIGLLTTSDDADSSLT